MTALSTLQPLLIPRDIQVKMGPLMAVGRAQWLAPKFLGMLGEEHGPWSHRDSIALSHFCFLF